ncbi:hypothetical protein [Allomesorhizobium camelthorni]|uniref:hypothetical protein n=1 Tax=Allomesorhizobium camelthorni TaxID=475069 RepID=UPI0019802C71|nr:hypothetical protein [Mesorhizobium camelthorni]
MNLAVAREVDGIRELLDSNPMVGARRDGSRRFWTGREEKLLRENYPGGGVSACLAVLPGRSAKSIYMRAGTLGLLRPGPDGKVHERQAWESSEQIDLIIRRTYQKSPSKGDIQKCAATCGRPRWWVSKRAVKLGLVVPRFKEPAWSEVEIEIVTENAHKAPATLQKMLRSKGFHRTETAIFVKLKRIGADRTDPNHLNANQLAGVMGVDRKTVSGWIAKGWLKATRREATATDDFWWIHRRDVARFIVENVAAVDLRKVDKFWFVDLLVHEGASPHAKAESKQAAILALAAARPDLNNTQLAAMTDSTATAVAVVKSKARHRKAVPA